MANVVHLRVRGRDVSSPVDSFVEFLERQRTLHGPRFPEVGAAKVLTFMATSSQAGTHPTVSLHRLGEVDATDSPGALRVRLVGRIPRPPAVGECLSVHLTRLEQYRGFQVKTLPVEAGEPPGTQLTEDGHQLTVNGRRTYTVHHSPYSLRFFEEIPLEEVREVAAGLPFALVAVAETANLSPRFVFHHEVQDGRVVLFHGDGLALKTAMNLRTNAQETRVVLDLDQPGGWQLQGTVEAIREQEHPVGGEKVHAGFASGGWGRPSKVYRLVADSLAPLAVADG
jgi:hypothetical protein